MAPQLPFFSMMLLFVAAAVEAAEAEAGSLERALSLSSLSSHNFPGKRDGKTFDLVTFVEAIVSGIIVADGGHDGLVEEGLAAVEEEDAVGVGGGEEGFMKVCEKGGETETGGDIDSEEAGVGVEEVENGTGPLGGEEHKRDAAAAATGGVEEGVRGGLGSDTVAEIFLWIFEGPALFSDLSSSRS